MCSCVVGWTDPLGVTIATATTANFVDTLDYYTTMIRYTALGENGTKFQTDVTFECRPDVEGLFYVKHVFMNKYFNLAVETKYACIAGTPPPAPPINFTVPSAGPLSISSSSTTTKRHDKEHEDRGLSAGTIILIIAGALLFVYVAGGVLVNWLTRSANADSSLCPQATFWVELWTNVVAGHLYLWWLVRGCPGAGSAGAGYGEGYEPPGVAVPVPVPVPSAEAGAQFWRGPGAGGGGADASSKYMSGSSSNYVPV